MGINPNSGDGVERNYTVDGRTDAENLVSDAEHTGQEAGKAFAHIAAQADSANTGMSELSKRIESLEDNTKRPLGVVEAVVKGTTSGEGAQSILTDIRKPSDGWRYRSEQFMRPNKGLWKIELIQEEGANLTLLVANQSGGKVGESTQIVNFEGYETAIASGSSGTPEGKTFYVLFTRLI